MKHLYSALVLSFLSLAVPAGAQVGLQPADESRLKIIQTEDDDLLGLRFAQPNGFAVPGFEVDLFIEKRDGDEEQYAPLINKIVQ